MQNPRSDDGESPQRTEGRCRPAAGHAVHRALGGRRLLLFAAAACLLVCGPFVVRWATTPAPGVMEENLGRLHTAMTAEEAAAIMGRPPDETTDSTSGVYLWPRRRWIGAEGDVCLFLLDGRLYDGHFSKPNEPNLRLKLSEPESLLDKLRRWAGL